MIWISPSQHAVFKECRRKWAYRYIDGIKVPPKKEQQFGTEGHARNEAWLRSGKHVGDDDVGLVCQQGIKPGYMPSPSPELLIEKKLDIVVLDGRAKMIGYIDCVDPPKVVANAQTLPIVCDWKFTKDLRWAMTPAELVEDSQAAVYSYWAHRKFNAEKVMVRWVYFCGRLNSKSEDGRPRTPRGVKKVELVFPAELILEHWDRELKVSEAIVETKAKFRQAKDVEPNELHCDAYGGCDYRDQCPLEGDAFLGSMLEQWERTHSGPIDNPDPQPKPTQEGEMSEDLLAKLKAHKQDVAAQKAKMPAETPPEPAEATPPPAPPATAEVIDAVPEYIEDEQLAAAGPPVDPGADLLARLQAAQGAKGVNPPAETAPPPAALPPAATPPPAETKAETASPPPEPEAKVETSATKSATPPPAETKVVVAAKPTKKAKDKASNGKAPFILAIDTIAAKLENGTLGRVVHLSELVEPIATAIAKGHRCEEHPLGIDHWSLIEFGNGPGVLANQVAAYLDKNQFEGVLVVDGSSLEGRALKDVLIRRADVVFRGVR